MLFQSLPQLGLKILKLLELPKGYLAKTFSPKSNATKVEKINSMIYGIAFLSI
jgi:hypothetical protein